MAGGPGGAPGVLGSTAVAGWGGPRFAPRSSPDAPSRRLPRPWPDAAASPPSPRTAAFGLAPRSPGAGGRPFRPTHLCPPRQSRRSSAAPRPFQRDFSLTAAFPRAQVFLAQPSITFELPRVHDLDHASPGSTWALGRAVSRRGHAFQDHLEAPWHPRSGGHRDARHGRQHPQRGPRWPPPRWGWPATCKPRRARCSGSARPSPMLPGRRAGTSPGERGSTISVPGAIPKLHRVVGAGADLNGHGPGR